MWRDVRVPGKHLKTRNARETRRPLEACEDLRLLVSVMSPLPEVLKVLCVALKAQPVG
jgi:hypothetical protein